MPLVLFKGIVHPKNKNVMFICLPPGHQDVGDFVSSVEHKQRILTQTVAVWQSYNASQWAQNLWEQIKHAQTNSKKTLLLLTIHWSPKTWNDRFVQDFLLLRKSNYLHLGCPGGKQITSHFHFWVNYPFNNSRNTWSREGSRANADFISVNSSINQKRAREQGINSVCSLSVHSAHHHRVGQMSYLE